MAKPLIAGLAPQLVCAPGYVVRVTALDPTTGATVAGVIVSDVALQVNTLTGEGDTGTDQLLPPLLAYVPVGG
jgi:hypothetical protein